MGSLIELPDGRLVKQQVIDELYACARGELQGELYEYPDLLWGITHLGGFLIEVGIEVSKDSVIDACAYIIDGLENGVDDAG